MPVLQRILAPACYRNPVSPADQALTTIMTMLADHGYNFSIPSWDGDAYLRISNALQALTELTITSRGTGRATVEFEASERYANPMGTLHGGVLCDLADAAMGVAYLSTLARGETGTTIELKINFLRPVWKAKLRAEAKVVRAGKTVALVECDIVDERQRLVARASSTCMTLRGRPAERPPIPRRIN